MKAIVTLLVTGALASGALAADTQRRNQSGAKPEAIAERTRAVRSAQPPPRESNSPAPAPSILHSEEAQESGDTKFNREMAARAKSETSPKAGQPPQPRRALPE